MQLRPYQSSALAEVQAVYRSGFRRVLLVAPTGAGKSAMTQYMLGRTTKRTLILCHRENLRDMISEGLSVPHGIIAGTRAIPSESVHVGMMQTVSRRLDSLPKYDWVISDEAHLAMCATWRSILQHYSAAWHLGLSATPCRLDGKGLGAEYERIVNGPSIGELTNRGFLSPCRVFAPPIDAQVDAKDSLDKQAHAMDKPGITGDAILHYKRYAPGRQAIVFCCNVQHAQNVADQFSAAGIPAVMVDGTQSKVEQSNKIAAFKARRAMVLVNVELLTTGFDCPQIECGIMLRRTASLALFLQIVGRILRIHPGKRDAILLDHVGNVIQHGFPDDDREFTLDGRPARAKAVSVMQCPKCYACHRPAPRCFSCGHVYATNTTSARGKINEKAGELVELDKSARPSAPDVKERTKAAFRLPSMSDTRAALEVIRAEMGYKPGWSMMQIELRDRYAARFRRRAA